VLRKLPKETTDAGNKTRVIIASNNDHVYKEYPSDDAGSGRS
jgi:hypothetical protein